MTLQEISELIANTQAGNYHLYFIVRSPKKGLKIKERRKALEKYDYIAYSADIDDALRDYFCNITKSQISKAMDNNWGAAEYDYIVDDTDKIQLYKDIEKISAFMSIINVQLPNRQFITISNISDLLENGSLWAYCLEIEYLEEQTGNYKTMQVFRKISNGKIAVDKNSKKSIKAIFDTNKKKLKVLHEESIKFDQKIDCLFIEGCFYILDKKSFEAMAGLEEVIKEKAIATVDEISKSGILASIDFLKSEVENNTSSHRKLVKIQRLGLPNGLTASKIAKMKKAAKYENKELRSKGNQLILENKEDLEVVLKVLCDYYKVGVITKNQYGTFSGKKLANGDE